MSTLDQRGSALAGFTLDASETIGWAAGGFVAHAVPMLSLDFAGHGNARTSFILGALELGGLMLVTPSERTGKIAAGVIMSTLFFSWAEGK